MSWAWERTHRQNDVMRTVLDEVARAGRGEVPAAHRAAIIEVFGDIGAFLMDVRRRWYRTFDARLDRLLEAPPDDMASEVRDLWRELDREQPAFRLLLDEHDEHGERLDAIDAHHRAALFAATGVDRLTRRVS